ncbi:hypothetical protein Pint_01798 [Pistacia integerrima]|uniref:Uncharacterized protein n=1 Tax=Pistacia integerrima TaxID=434235 RepID=A0ACC0ZH23_9ROSI|nr:hypothetical protein Pint_01798 [Pistacia integerrima]
MKQKVEIEISWMDTSKSSRVKALTTAIAFSGVESVAIKGNEKKLLEVTGVGMDLDALITSLNIKVAPAEPLSISILGRDDNGPVTTIPGPSPSLGPSPFPLGGGISGPVRRNFVIHQSRLVSIPAKTPNSF